MRQLPIFTVVNKMDRPALNGFEIIEQLEKEFGLPAYPVNWWAGQGRAGGCLPLHLRGLVCAPLWGCVF